MKVIPTTFIQALSQRKIKLHISADINWKTEFSGGNYCQLFDLSEIAHTAGFDCWSDFIINSSFEDIEAIMNESFHNSANSEPKSTSKKHKKESSGYVYMMTNNRNGYTKIGFSKSPEYREKTLQSEEPEIDLIFKTKASKDFERHLHDQYCSKRIRGEWFNLSEDDKANISSMAEWRDQ